MTEVEITFKKEGFIGIFDNVFEDEYLDELIKFFESNQVISLRTFENEINGKKI